MQATNHPIDSSYLQFHSAGVTDSALTNHGLLQAQRLGAHLAAINVKVEKIFSSDLTRAYKTAEAVRAAQPAAAKEPHNGLQVEKLALLREQDFGSYEGMTFADRSRDEALRSKRTQDANGVASAFRDVETKEAMRARADAFVEGHLIELIEKFKDDTAVVIVAHGIILAHLWRSILSRFHPTSVSLAPDATRTDRPVDLQHLGMWSNTGYLELECKQTLSNSIPTQTLDETIAEGEGLPAVAAPKKLDMSLVVKAVNSVEHLKGLKKTRGGIGSSKHDEGQKSIESFFKKRKIG
jgi:broad specificity phosphatase PhoE